jgi:hypothetical protein
VKLIVIMMLAMIGDSYVPAALADSPTLVRSSGSGRWSDSSIWEGGHVPGAGARVQVRPGHVIIYDIQTDQAIRSIHIAGSLRFATDRDTRLDVGLIKIQSGDDPCETGFDRESHPGGPGPGAARAALFIGSPDRPVSADHSALVRLTWVKGLDPEECPAIVCCGGRMELHGAELSRTWVKLAATASRGSTTVTLDQPVTGWKVGDRVIVTASTKRSVPDEETVANVRANLATEERTIRAIDGNRVSLDSPLAFAHAGTGKKRAEVANLSRNVVVESAQPDGQRGHTMYHRNSTGSISYAEFRHLGKKGKLGKYSLHFHRVGDTMWGASVVGASIWDSDNRWVTIHGTNRLVVRDCVGYQSVGHGFYLEDGTEVENVLDGNLAVQACQGSPLPGQALPFDRNEGAGFWWANSRNAFMRNVAVECDEYGFRYQADAGNGFDPVLSVRTCDGSLRSVDVRTQPFLRFEDNEAHAQPRYGLNLGGGRGSGKSGGVAGVGPDSRHPFLIRGLNIWDTHWAVLLAAPGVLIDGVEITDCEFGLWRPQYDRHAYRNLKVHHSRWAFFAETGKRPMPAGYPAPLTPIDDRPPVTIVTRTSLQADGRLLVAGVTADDGDVKSVRVNGRPARPVTPNYSQWEVLLEGADAAASTLVACAQDAAGNTEPTPHQINLR